MSRINSMNSITQIIPNSTARMVWYMCHRMGLLFAVIELFLLKGVDPPTDPAILVSVPLSADHSTSGDQFTVVHTPGTIGVLPA